MISFSFLLLWEEDRKLGRGREERERGEGRELG